ncbi:Hypothetical predicted protein [Mytilus galloprovincialis]|uniref:DUF7869 domain-containing protein n=1 Tax=Mytilus galloprovincialis TaxID=29158 RepID=A0A8B6CMZ9_MYTGA|nr:Hypothetical predicted protein [Mytilus galloprovincialis]
MGENPLLTGPRRLKRDLAKAHPTRYLSLIIDGMNQSKTNLPHFVGRTAKSVNPGNQLTTHITGILAHGQQAFFSFLDWCQYPHDSNLKMNLLLGIIYEIAAMNGGTLPPVLYIQADNCWRENKNKYVLSFCELLVHMKVFQEVHLSFLYVGHTHEDIDAGFSKIVDSLRRNDAETIPELLDLLPNPSNLIWQYDIRNWLQPFIADVRKHTKPLHYKFTMDEVSNKIKLCYKSNHAGPWKISTSGMFMFNDKGEVELPKGVPKVSTPVFDKISIEKIESGINDWKCLFTDQIEHHQFNWWKSRVNYRKKLRDDNKFMKSEIIQKAVWYFDKYNEN